VETERLFTGELLVRSDHLAVDGFPADRDPHVEELIVWFERPVCAARDRNARGEQLLIRMRHIRICAAVVVEEIPAKVVEVPRRFVVNRELMERGPFYECAVISRRSASCGDRQKSIVETRWTQPTVQYGAQDFAVENSRRISSVV
jgi:hypothetical protein